MHHAYLFLDSLSHLASLAADARERFGFLGEHRPDVQARSYEKFGIEEARELKTLAGLKNTSGRALYIVGVSQITTEAQQALLKLFEEPQEGSVFVLLAPHGSILPTLRSRLLEYPIEWKQSPGQNSLASPVAKRQDKETQGLFGKDFAEAFLATSYKTRSEEVAKLLKDEDGTRERVRDFLNSLEVSLHAAFLKSKSKKELREALEDVSKVRSYANDRSPSLKMLLEHLALSLPLIK